MKRKSIGAIGFALAMAALLIAASDKYTLKVPGGLAFSEFRGYEAWQLVSISQDGPHIAAIVANPVMISAYQAAFPATASPSRMAPRWRRYIGTRPRWRPSRQRRCRVPRLTSTS